MFVFPKNKKPTRNLFKLSSTRTSLMNKIVLIVIAVLVVVLAGGAYVILSPSAPDTAVLYIERGAVEVNMGSGWQTAQDDMDLKQGDHVRTTDGEATVVLLEGEILHLQPNSEVTLNQVSSKSISISQLSGETWNRVTKLSGIKSYTVTTPNTVATVRGTTFYYNDDEVTVEDGVVSFGPPTNPNQMNVNPNKRANRNNWQDADATDVDYAKFEQFRQKQINALTRIRAREIKKHTFLLKQADKQGYNAEKRAQMLSDIDNDPKPSEDDAYNKAPSLLKPQAKRTYKLTKEIKKALHERPAASGGSVENCATPSKCRVFAACANTVDGLMDDGTSAGCIDAYNASAQHIDYCGHFTLGSGGRACNYQDSTTKAQCVCP